MASVRHPAVVDRQINAADYAEEHEVTLEAADINDALGYTPANAADLAGYATDGELAAEVAARIAGDVALDAADDALAASLATEVATREAADTTLTNGHNTQQALIDALIAQGGGAPVLEGLVSGGVVTWESAYTFRVSAAVYYIAGVQYTAAEQTVSLTAAHATLDRIDVLALDNTGDFVAVTGTAAAQPSEPDIDPTTQLRLTFVLVGAATSAPASVTITNIYLENTEWTSSTSGSGINANSSTNPKSGTKCIEATNMGNNAYVLLDKGAVDLDINTQRLLRLFVRSKASWASSRVLRLQFFANGVAKGSPVTLGHGYWGFDSTNTASYQLVAIPINQFIVPPGTLIDQLRITDVGGALGFYIDEVTLESNAASVGPSPLYLTKAQADLLYAPLLLVPTTVTGTTYATTASDNYVSKLLTNAALVTVTLNDLPAIGSRVRITAMGAAGFTFAAGAGMTLRSRGAAGTSSGQYSVAEGHRISATEWSILGDVA